MLGLPALPSEDLPRRSHTAKAPRRKPHSHGGLQVHPAGLTRSKGPVHSGPIVTKSPDYRNSRKPGPHDGGAKTYGDPHYC